MERNLGGGNHIQTSERVQERIASKGLHHCLIIGLCVVGTLYHQIAARKGSLHVPFLLAAAGTEISLIVRSYRTESLPVLLRVNQHGIVLRCPKIQHRRQNLVLHLNQLQGLICRRFRFSCHNGGHVSCKPDSSVNNIPVIGAWLRIGLSRLGKAKLRRILPGQHANHARHLLSLLCVDFLYQRVSVRASQRLHDQAVRGSHIVCVNRTSRHKSHGVLFHSRTGDKALFSQTLLLVLPHSFSKIRQSVFLFQIYCFLHEASPPFFVFLYSSQFLIARIWPA